MIVLGADTSTGSLTISLINEKKVLAGSNIRGALRHSSLLVPAVEKILKKARLKIAGIDLFAVGLGPGSFTGLRVGVTTMRAFAIALHRPIIGVPTLDVIAYNGLAYLTRKKEFSNDVKICPILDAKKNQVYACIYSRDNAKIKRESAYLLEPPEVLSKRLKGRVLFLGDAVPLYKGIFAGKKQIKADFIEGNVWLPKASVIAKLALEEYRNGRRDNPYDLAPMYLYARDCNVRKD